MIDLKVKNSKILYERAAKTLVGGVNSPVRAFKAVGGTPLFIRRAHGSKIEDEDGNSYIDFVCSWGALILGSAFPRITKTLHRHILGGTTYGAPTKLEIELAEMITSAIPSIQRIRFVNSGTEASMSALRVARAFTRRKRILKFEGCYHGHADSLLVKGGSGMATFGAPDSAGVTEGAIADTLVAPYNDLAAVDRIFEKQGEAIAAVIVEPVAANMGVVLPRNGFLDGLRRLTTQYGSLLVFDEVITGFRVSYGGAQEAFGIQPDLTCLGKIIGGGLPVGAYGGRGDIMGQVAPIGPVYQAGTLSGNPLTMAAGIATLRELEKRNFYEKLEKKSKELQHRLASAAEEEGCKLRINRVGSMLGLFFTDSEVVDYSSAKSSDAGSYRVFFHSMLNHGIYFPPSAFETIFVSAAHSLTDIELCAKAAKGGFRNVVTKGANT
ncbi:MAG: glutamate-1-semialdehyde 2,1-aminomutase [Candidatus Bathyarchaeia archaeon]